jgi:signal transduction histidine kinase
MSDLRIVLANASAERNQEVSCGSSVETRCSEVVPGTTLPCENCVVRATFADGQPHRKEVSRIDANGDRWVTEIQTKPLSVRNGEVEYVMEVFRDLSNEKRLERQLMQSAKLVSIGEVAAGIAHEIRNPLAGIRLGLDALDPASLEDPSAKDILDDITRDIVRLDRVVSDLLSFTKAKASQPEWFHLHSLFNQACRFIRGAAELQGITLEVEVSPPDLRIWADRNQIHQVLLNLLLNAVQAMPEGGTLHLAGKRSDSLNWSSDRKDRAGYRITVRDTGPGIPEENMHRLFDPFFTTKPSGTGLGLATSLSIIRRHDGEIRINSTPGQGTTAQFLLPEGNPRS